MIGEAREANVTAVLLVQGIVHFADDRPIGFTKGSRADLVAGQPERGGIGRRDGNGVRKCVGIVLELPEEKQPVLADRPTQGEGLVAPAAVGLDGRKRGDRLQGAGAPLTERRAVKLVGAGFHHHVDLAAGCSAELSRIAVGQGLGLRNCLRRHDDEANLAVAAVLRVVESVQVPLRAFRSAEGELGGREGTGRNADDPGCEQ